MIVTASIHYLSRGQANRNKAMPVRALHWYLCLLSAWIMPPHDLIAIEGGDEFGGDT